MPPQQQAPQMPPSLLLQQQQTIDQLIAEYAAQQNISPDQLRALIEVESSFNPQAVSPKGAMGLMQLMPGTAKQFGVTDPFDPAQNIRGGATYYRSLLDQYGGNEDLALAAYNAGPAAVEEYGNQVPPFPETTEFIRRIRTAQQPADVQAARQEIEHTGTIWFSPEDKAQLRGGIRIAYTGEPPTQEERDQIKDAVSPRGFITREDWPMIGGGVGGFLGGLRRLPLTRFANPLAQLGISVGSAATAGIGGAAGEWKRQEEMPDSVAVGGRRFDILGWPQSSLFGTTVEGAPQNPEDRFWAMAVRGAEQVLGETVAGWLGGLLFRWPGRMLQKSGMKSGPKLELELQYRNQDILRLSQDLSRGYIQRGAPGVRGFGPNKGSYHRAIALRNMSAQIADQMVSPYHAQTIDPMKVSDRVFDLIGPSFSKERLLGQPGAENQLLVILESFLGAHGQRINPASELVVQTARPINVKQAAELKRMADRMATPAWLGQASQNLTTAARPEIAKAFSQALRELIEEQLPSAVATRWRTQNARTQAAIAVSTMIQQATGGPAVTGVGTGMLASAGLGSVLTGSAVPLAATAPVIPFLSPPGRSVIGRSLTQAGRVPAIAAAGRGSLMLGQEGRPGADTPLLGPSFEPTAQQWGEYWDQMQNRVRDIGRNIQVPAGGWDERIRRPAYVSQPR